VFIKQLLTILARIAPPGYRYGTGEKKRHPKVPSCSAYWFKRLLAVAVRLHRSRRILLIFHRLQFGSHIGLLLQ